jgi:hypothetical protein
MAGAAAFGRLATAGMEIEQIDLGMLDAGRNTFPIVIVHRDKAVGQRALMRRTQCSCQSNGPSYSLQTLKMMWP